MPPLRFQVNQGIRAASFSPPRLYGIVPCQAQRLEERRKASDVRFGSQADIRSAKRHVRFTPNSDHKSRNPQTVMSALPPKADMCGATGHVCLGPIADISSYSISSLARPRATYYCLNSQRTTDTDQRAFRSRVPLRVCRLV